VNHVSKTMDLHHLSSPFRQRSGCGGSAGGKGGGGGFNFGKSKTLRNLFGKGKERSPLKEHQKSADPETPQVEGLSNHIEVPAGASRKMGGATPGKVKLGRLSSSRERSKTRNLHFIEKESYLSPPKSYIIGGVKPIHCREKYSPHRGRFRVKLLKTSPLSANPQKSPLSEEKTNVEGEQRGL